jgi:hypothetical protein
VHGAHHRQPGVCTVAAGSWACGDPRGCDCQPAIGPWIAGARCLRRLAGTQAAGSAPPRCVVAGLVGVAVLVGQPVAWTLYLTSADIERTAAVFGRWGADEFFANLFGYRQQQIGALIDPTQRLARGRSRVPGRGVASSAATPES